MLKILIPGQKGCFEVVKKNFRKELEDIPFTIYFVSQSTFNMNNPEESLETLQDIRRMMERSSRFISLSGLSGVSAGVFALGGAYIAHAWLGGHPHDYNSRGSYAGEDFHSLLWKQIGRAHV